MENIRIEELRPFEKKMGISTDTIWITPANVESNLEECLNAVVSNNIEHLHLQTNKTHFLNDVRLKNIKGIFFQFEIEYLNPLFSFPNLTHLTLPNDLKEVFDFSFFKNLIFLGGSMPKKYINFDKLTKLRHTYLFRYKKSDFTEFSNCKDLKELEIYSLNIKNLHGLEHLKHLEKVDLDLCVKLESLEGFSSQNINLKQVSIKNAKSLKQAESLTFLPNLNSLQLYNILNLDSLSFLNDLKSINDIDIHPDKVGVVGNDYYPLIDALKKTNQLDNLKNWKPLQSFLKKEIKINAEEIKSELELLKFNLPIKGWANKSEECELEQYTKENCEKAEAILIALIDNLKDYKKMSLKEKLAYFKNCVLELNKFNEDLDECFIETGEREELCEILDNIAVAAEIDIQNFEDGIASEWRSW